MVKIKCAQQMLMQFHHCFLLDTASKFPFSTTISSLMWFDKRYPCALIPLAGPPAIIEYWEEWQKRKLLLITMGSGKCILGIFHTVQSVAHFEPKDGKQWEWLACRHCNKGRIAYLLLVGTTGMNTSADKNTARSFPPAVSQGDFYIAVHNITWFASLCLQPPLCS